MRALCARRLARSGLLPGLMRLAGGASVVLTSPHFVRPRSGSLRLRYRKAGQPGSKMAQTRVTSGA